jgi:hypothetical protein
MLRVALFEAVIVTSLRAIVFTPPELSINTLAPPAQPKHVASIKSPITTPARETGAPPELENV